jgi:hypothetical protein
MTDKEREDFEEILSAEVDTYQATYIDGLIAHNDRFKAPLSERCADPAIARLWI